VDHRRVRLLLVEDEERLAAALARGLSEEGHAVERAATGGEARERGRSGAFDVIVLDRALPDLDGVALLREWRAGGLAAPVLLLTARGTTGEKVEGLRAGADDYLVKPFDFEELLARLEVLHRRGAGRPDAALGGAVLDARRRALTRGGASEPLTGREYALLAALSDRPGGAVSRASLLADVWRDEPGVNGNVVDVYVGYLRTKLERIGADVRIDSVRGVGYRLVFSRPLPREA
jgi:two-component system, OmpR family, response regulator